MAEIVYDVKEVLDRMDRDSKDAFRRLEVALHDRLGQHSTRIGDVERRLAGLEAADGAEAAVRHSMRRMRSEIVAVAATLIAAATVYIERL